MGSRQPNMLFAESQTCCCENIFEIFYHFSTKKNIIRNAIIYVAPADVFGISSEFNFFFFFPFFERKST